MPYLTDEEYEELEADAKQKAQVEKLWKRDAEHLLEVGIKNAALTARVKELEEALGNLLKNHVRLVESGDCGSWDVETEKEVIEARAALRGEA